MLVIFSFNFIYMVSESSHPSYRVSHGNTLSFSNNLKFAYEFLQIIFRVLTFLYLYFKTIVLF